MHDLKAAEKNLKIMNASGYDLHIVFFLNLFEKLLDYCKFKGLFGSHKDAMRIFEILVSKKCSEKIPAGLASRLLCHYIHTPQMHEEIPYITKLLVGIKSSSEFKKSCNIALKEVI
jgi:hypothetical protein